MIAHYAERFGEPSPFEVAFFRGGLPDDALLQAAGGRPLRLAASPADLNPDALRPLLAAGLQAVEVEVLTLDDGILRACRRGYRASALQPMLAGLRRMGLQVGLVLTPGLPGSSHASSLAEARWLCDDGQGRPRIDFVRLSPAVAWRGAESASWVAQGRWSPMTLGQAVTTLRALVEVFDQAEVPVIRVGIQPGQDQPHRISAGPQHPNLRGLVEVRRFRSRMRRALMAAAVGPGLALRVHPKDLSWAKGTANENMRAMRAAFALPDLILNVDDAVPRGTVRVSAAT